MIVLFLTLTVNLTLAFMCTECGSGGSGACMIWFAIDESGNSTQLVNPTIVLDNNHVLTITDHTQQPLVLAKRLLVLGQQPLLTY